MMIKCLIIIFLMINFCQNQSAGVYQYCRQKPNCFSKCCDQNQVCQSDDSMCISKSCKPQSCQYGCCNEEKDICGEYSYCFSGELETQRQFGIILGVILGTLVFIFCAIKCYYSARSTVRVQIVNNQQDIDQSERQRESNQNNDSVSNNAESHKVIDAMHVIPPIQTVVIHSSKKNKKMSLQKQKQQAIDNSVNDQSARNGLITSEMVQQSMIMHANKLTERTFDETNIDTTNRQSDRRLRILSLQNTKDSIPIAVGHDQSTGQFILQYPQYEKRGHSSSRRILPNKQFMEDVVYEKEMNPSESMKSQRFLNINQDQQDQRRNLQKKNAQQMLNFSSVIESDRSRLSNDEEKKQDETIQQKFNSSQLNNSRQIQQRQPKKNQSLNQSINSPH